MEIDNKEQPKLEERMWDYTTLDMYLRCKRKYYWRIKRDLEHMTTSPALDFGKTVHSSLEHYYKNNRSLAKALGGQSVHLCPLSPLLYDAHRSRQVDFSDFISLYAPYTSAKVNGRYDHCSTQEFTYRVGPTHLSRCPFSWI